jgi:Rieske Fe-S protein
MPRTSPLSLHQLPSSQVDGTSCTGCSPLPADSYNQLERRHILKQGVLAAVAATLSACARGSAPPVNTVPLGVWAIRVRPSDFPELVKTWGIARVDCQSDNPVAVVRTSTGFAAFSLRCPHAGVTVGINDGAFLCPGHGAEFKADGSWSGGHKAKNLKSLVTTYEESTGTLTISIA